jgi:hypothetical protein
LNLYNEDSYLLSGYGQLYFNGSSKDFAPNVSRSTSRVGCVLDMDEGTLRYFLNGKDLGIAISSEKLKEGEYFITATFGKGSTGSSWRLLNDDNDSST